MLQKGGQIFLAMALLLRTYCKKWATLENHFGQKNGKEIKGGGLTKAQRQALEEGEVISFLMYGLGFMKHRCGHWHDTRHDDMTVLEKLGNDTMEIP